MDIDKLLKIFFRRIRKNLRSRLANPEESCPRRLTQPIGVTQSDKEDEMTESSALDILKHAILLEKRGKAFYRTAADQSINDDVKAFFATMAAEEVQHVKILSEQYKAFKETGRFKAPDAQATGTISKNVLTPEVKSRIAAADFEAAAISAAMLMEERAIALYAKRTNEAQDPEEKKLYRWLADWEKEHLEFLAAIDGELKERIWNDSGFWPF
jgi:rubrerythrin